MVVFAKVDKVANFGSICITCKAFYIRLTIAEHGEPGYKRVHGDERVHGDLECSPLRFRWSKKKRSPTCNHAQTAAAVHLATPSCDTCRHRDDTTSRQQLHREYLSSSQQATHVQQTTYTYTLNAANLAPVRCTN
ncbi:unnamed protein product [Ectocarpus sp. 12 AP-2014]